MASKQAAERLENLDEMLSFSSEDEGEEHDAASYGSDLQPPGLVPGFTMVPSNCCRAMYKPSTVSKGSKYLICLNKESCRSLYGGKDHSALRGQRRADPGIYEGVYGKSGKLLSAKAGTLTTALELKQRSEMSRASDRSRVATMEILNRESPSFSISAADDQTIEDADGKVEEVLDTISGESPTAKDAIFVKLLSSLCQKIDSIGTELSNSRRHGNQQGSSAASDRVNPSILRPPRSSRRTTQGTDIASAAKWYKDRASARMVDEVEDHEDIDETEEGMIVESDESDSGSREGGEWSEMEKRTPRSKDSRRGSRKGKKKARKVSTSSKRLYAIAWGKGGIQTSGLYRAT